jgi:hypothetical protein
MEEIGCDERSEDSRAAVFGFVPPLDGGEPCSPADAGGAAAESPRAPRTGASDGAGVAVSAGAAGEVATAVDLRTVVIEELDGVGRTSRGSRSTSWSSG